MSPQELRETVRKLGPWFHQIDLGAGVRTRDIAPAPGPQPKDHPADRWAILQDAIPQDLGGKRVLDIGCAEGFFAIEMARRGAEVVAIDAAPKMISRLQWVIEHLGLKTITAKVATLESLATSAERYDVVLMIALLYHLRHPLLGTDIAARLTDTLYVESVLHTSNDHSFLFLEAPIPGVHDIPKWVPTERCVIDMLQFSGFREISVLPRPHARRGIYLARKSGDPVVVSN